MANASPPQPRRPTPRSLGAIIGNFKSATTRRINRLRDCPGGKVWQRNYYEHIIRNDREWGAVRAYVLANPSRWTFDRDNPARFSKSAAAGAIEDYLRDARVW